jgi:hypothetical protein
MQRWLDLLTMPANCPRFWPATARSTIRLQFRLEVEEKAD